MQDIKPSWTEHDTTSLAYQRKREGQNPLFYKADALLYTEGLAMRVAFLDSVRRHTPWVFDQEAVVVEFPLSGETASVQFFLIYRVNQDVRIRKYHWGLQENRWHAGSVASGRALNQRRLLAPSRCYEQGANSEVMSVAQFRDHGNTVAVQYYPPYSYCGDLQLLYSL